MLGNFSYKNATKLYFGEDSLKFLNEELPKYGKNVVLIYGGGSIKKNGIYEAVIEILKQNGKKVAEDAGVMPNPTIEKVREGVKIAKAHKADLLLAVGGGSCCDYAKVISASVHCDEDPWEKYFLRNEKTIEKIVPVGCVLTMAGTGSEMNAGAVITNRETHQKLGHGFGEEAVPRFSILNPRFTMSLPKWQMVAGIYDIFCHICEQYFSGEDDNVSDDLAEALMKSVVRNSLVAVENPEDYVARSNIMWAATWALNTLISRGKKTDWMVHKLGHAVSAYTDATHGMTLAAVSLPYYKIILPYGLHKFKQFAINVWGVNPAGKSDTEIANEGLTKMEKWMKQIGVALHTSELGVTEDMIEGLADATFVIDGGYKRLTRDEVLKVFRESL